MFPNIEFYLYCKAISVIHKNKAKFDLQYFQLVIKVKYVLFNFSRLKQEINASWFVKTII